jgi:hypothetical protein
LRIRALPAWLRIHAQKSPGTGEVPRLLISLSFAKAQLVQHFNEVFMTDNRDKIKTEPHSVVFVCEQSIAVSAKSCAARLHHGQAILMCPTQSFNF